MNPDIHPDYHPVVFQDATTGAMFSDPIDHHQFAHHRRQTASKPRRRAAGPTFDWPVENRRKS